LKKNRLQSLDFLRAIAIVLVIFRHKYLYDFTVTLGWIGVDLFFVLSGFLVSGLLFREYKKHGNFKAKLFLIRRGFKIYPIYYLSFLFYLPYLFSKNSFNLNAIFNDLIFIQNYTNGWGYVYAASWSLAVEEHFYFSLCLVFSLILKYFPSVLIPLSKKLNLFEKGLILCLLMCLLFRVLFIYNNPEDVVRAFTMSHLRMDSLLFGVFISYWYYFKNEKIKAWFFRNKSILAIVAFGFLIFTPFIEPLTSFYVKTIGFTMLYLSFGILLLFALFDKVLFSDLTKLIGAKSMKFICNIGFSSYSIYVIHTLVIYLIAKLNIEYRYLSFLLVLGLSIFAGILLTRTIESYFLRIRDRFYKSRY